MSAAEIDPDVAPICPQSKDGEHCDHWEDCGACCLCHEGEVDADAFLADLSAKTHEAARARETA